MRDLSDTNPEPIYYKILTAGKHDFRLVWSIEQDSDFEDTFGANGKPLRFASPEGVVRYAERMGMIRV